MSKRRIEAQNALRDTEVLLVGSGRLDRNDAQDIINRWQEEASGVEGGHAPSAAEVADNVKMFSHYDKPEAYEATPEILSEQEQRIAEREKLFKEIGF